MPWYKDIVKQYEQLQMEEGRGKKKYAAQHALFDLDGVQSVKTMHEKNDNVVNLDEMEEDLDGDVEVSKTKSAKRKKGQRRDSGPRVKTSPLLEMIRPRMHKRVTVRTGLKARMDCRRDWRGRRLPPVSSRVTHPQVLEYGSHHLRTPLRPAEAPSHPPLLLQ